MVVVVVAAAARCAVGDDDDDTIGDSFEPEPAGSTATGALVVDVTNRGLCD